MNLNHYTTKLRHRHNSPGQFRQTLLLLLMLSTAVGSATNLSREKRISEGLEANLSDGSPIWLEAESVRFLGIHRQTAKAIRLGGVILLHDNSAHADWHEVINPLRRHLTERGWETLSIQTPITDDPSEPETVRGLLTTSLPRIQTAVDFLTQREVGEIALIGHGMGARMALNFISQPGSDPGAVVAIGVSMSVDDDEDPVLRAIKAARTPILDLYGSRDHHPVVDSAPLRRAAAARNGHDRYRQVEVAGADHFFTGIQEELDHRVASWLRQAIGQKSSNTPSDQ